MFRQFPQVRKVLIDKSTLTVVNLWIAVREVIPINTYTFYDIFDAPSLEKLTKSLSASFHVGISIRGPQGQRLTADSDYCRFCPDMIRNSPIGRIRCEQSMLALCALQEVSPCICRCQPTGLINAGINVIVDGVHMVSIMAGQVRLEGEELEEEEYRSIARSLQIDEEEYLRGIRSTPVMTRRQFESILDSLSLLAEQLSQLGHKNLYLKSLISSLENQEVVHQKEIDILETLAERDSMTGLYNRRKFEEITEEYARQPHRRICMISADANFLKLTNDIFGHESGDLLLKTIAKVMQDLAKGNWLVARCGGDEFRVILPDTSLETALDYCRRVARNCRKDRSLALPLSVSMGAAEWNSESETLPECFVRADAKMYQNKTAQKHELRVPDYIMERLYDRQILNKNVVDSISKLTLDFALYLGFSPDKADYISMAAHYQDIGMAKLPESFVIRGQSHTSEETTQIHMHVTHSYTMARQFDQLYKIADIIHSSHENWNGESYPCGLKEEQIPIESRILHLTSDYVSLSLPTVTGGFLSKEETRRRLIKDSGVVYDPALVTKFLEFLDKEESS